MKQTMLAPSPVVTSRRRFIQLGVAAAGRMAWAGTWLQTRLFPAGVPLKKRSR